MLPEVIMIGIIRIGSSVLAAPLRLVRSRAIRRAIGLPATPLVAMTGLVAARSKGRSNRKYIVRRLKPARRNRVTVTISASAMMIDPLCDFYFFRQRTANPNVHIGQTAELLSNC